MEKHYFELESVYCMVMKAFLLVFVLFACCTAAAQLTYQQLEVHYDSAIEYKNLKIIPIKEKNDGGASAGSFLSLGKAIRQGIVTVSERGTASTENVHWLRINNKSNIPLFIASGEVVMGGRQDRMVTRDTVLVPTGKDQYVWVMCVEEDRWSEKEKKFAYFNYANPRLRKVVDQSHNQVRIWKEIFNQLDSSKTKSPTLSYTGQRTEKKILPIQDEYMRAITDRLKRSDSSWTGFICVSGDRIIGCDIFAGASLFYDQVESLLQGYVEEAIVRGSIPGASNEKVKKYIDPILINEESQINHLKTNGKIYRFKGKVIHITGFGE